NSGGHVHGDGDSDVVEYHADVDFHGNCAVAEDGHEKNRRPKRRVAWRFRLPNQSPAWAFLRTGIRRSMKLSASVISRTAGTAAISHASNAWAANPVMRAERLSTEK